MTVSERGYTKHYFAAGERIASVIGGGGHHRVNPDLSLGSIADAPDCGQFPERCRPFENYFVDNWVQTLPSYEDMDDAYGQWQEDPRFQSVLDFFDMNCFSYDCWEGESFKELMEKIVYNNTGWEMEWTQGMKLSEYLDMLYNHSVDSDCGSKISVPVPRKAEWQGASLVEAYTEIVSGHTAGEIYYYHSNHLGSGSVITDENGGVYQALAYAPFGEALVNIKTGAYDESYKFTAYERDEKTGFDYAHQRYYWSDLGIFLSVDPMFHKYPGISAYVYCANNPVKYIDPDGRKIVLAGSSEFKKTTFNDIQKLSSNNLVMLKNGTVVESSKYKGDRAAIALSGIGSGNKEYGTKMIGDLVSNTKHTVTIQQTGDENNSFLPASNAHARTSGVGSGGTLSYDPETTGYNIVNQDGTTRAPAFISLGHKLIHADKAMKGKTLDVNDNNGKTDPDLLPMVHQKRSPEEIDTRVKENILRKENNVKPRAIPD